MPHGIDAGLADSQPITGLTSLVARYKADPESVYNTWFVGSEERMKAFRSIRRGVHDTVEAIQAGRFGADFKGSPLEIVLTAITEQKQVFEGAAHPFYWKPKLRIPDIYENEPNKRRFGDFLRACLDATKEDQVLAELSHLAEARIKGLGPAVANIAYFLHPTIVPPFNTAILAGFNALFGSAKRLGSWESYLGIREAVVETNGRVRDSLSKDLGAFAGLLFEIGSGRLLVQGNVDAVLQVERVRAEKAARARHAAVTLDHRAASEHTRVQHLLIGVGRALGYDVFVARNDRHRSCEGQPFAARTLPGLPPIAAPPEVLATIGLIDVIWFKPGTAEVVCAFEVEKSTSIYSGLLRLEDLARSMAVCPCHLYLVAPDDREREVMAQFARPAFRQDLAAMPFAYLSFGSLSKHFESLCQLGEDHTILRKISRVPPSSA